MFHELQRGACVARNVGFSVSVYTTNKPRKWVTGAKWRACSVHGCKTTLFDDAPKQDDKENQLLFTHKYAQANNNNKTKKKENKPAKQITQTNVCA